MKPREGDTPSTSISTTLLHGVKAFDKDAWYRLVDLFSPFVYRWFRRWGVPPDRAPDLVQNVFAKVSKGIVRFRRDTPEGTFRGWLWTIARNEANDYFQQQRNLHASDSFLNSLPDPANAEEERNEAAELMKKVLEMIRGDFNEKTYQIFWRTQMEGHDVKQIAVDFGMKESSVREAKRRVMSRLREECLELLGRGYWPFETANRLPNPNRIS